MLSHIVIRNKCNYLVELVGVREIIVPSNEGAGKTEKKYACGMKLIKNKQQIAIPNCLLLFRS
jgi:hypothetical protein